MGLTLAMAGVEVVSTWHESGATVEFEAELPKRQQLAIAAICLAEVDRATHFVWLHGDAEGRFGAVFEYGYAYARGIPCVCVDVTGSGQWAPSVFGTLGINMSLALCESLLTTARVLR
jgi:nucleoside 2-deoxyribosyltransferase